MMTGQSRTELDRARRHARAASDEQALKAREAARLAEARDDLQRAVELTCWAVARGREPDEGVEDFGRMSVNDVFAGDLDGFYRLWDEIVGTDMDDKQMEAVVAMVDGAFWFGLTRAHVRLTGEAGLSRRLFPTLEGVSGL